MSNTPPPSVSDAGLRGRHPLDADYYGSEGTSEPRGYLAGTGSLSVSGVSPAMAGEEAGSGRYASPMAREEGSATPQAYAQQAAPESYDAPAQAAALPTTGSSGDNVASDSPVFSGSDFSGFQLPDLPVQQNSFAPADYVDNSSVITGGNSDLTTGGAGGGGGGGGSGSGNTYNITTNIENNYTATQEVDIDITLHAGDRVDARSYSDSHAIDDHSTDDHSHHYEDHSVDDHSTHDHSSHDASSHDHSTHDHSTHDDHSQHGGHDGHDGHHAGHDGHDGHDGHGGNGGNGGNGGHGGNGHDEHDHHAHGHGGHGHDHPHAPHQPPQPPQGGDCHDGPHFPLPGWHGLPTPGQATGEPEIHAKLETGIDGLDPELSLNTGLINHKVIDLSATTSTLTRAVQQTLGLAMPIVASLGDGVRGALGLQLSQLAPAAGGEAGQEVHLSAPNLLGPLSPELNLNTGLIGHPVLDVHLPGGHDAQAAPSISGMLPETLETVGSAFGSGQALPFAGDHLHGVANSLNDSASHVGGDISGTLSAVNAAASDGSLLSHVLAGDAAGGNIDGIVHGVGDSITDSALNLGDPGSELSGLRDVQDNLGAGVHHLADQLGHLGGDLIGGLSQTLGGIGGALGGLSGGLNGTLGDLGSHLGGTLGNISGGLNATLGHVGDGLGGLVNGALATTSHIAGQLNDGLSGVVGGVVDGVNGLPSTVGDVASGIGGVVGGVTGGLGNVAGGVTGTIGNVVAHPADAVGGLVGTVGNVGAHVNDGVNGVVGTVSHVNDAVGGAVAGVGGALSGVVNHAASGGGISLPVLGHHSSAFASESSHPSVSHDVTSNVQSVAEQPLGALDDGLGHLSASLDSAVDQGLSALSIEHGTGSGDAASLLDLHLDHATSGLDLSTLGHEQVLDLHTLLADGSNASGIDLASAGHDATDSSSLGDHVDHAASAAVSSLSHALSQLPVHHGS